MGVNHMKRTFLAASILFSSSAFAESFYPPEMVPPDVVYAARDRVGKATGQRTDCDTIATVFTGRCRSVQK